MRFAHQQILALSPGLLLIAKSMVGLVLSSDANVPFVAEEIHIVILTPLQILFYFAIIRYVCWACWGTKRGEVLLRHVGLRGSSKHYRPTRLERWWFYLDENGQLK